MDPLSITLSITALLKLTKDVVLYIKEAKEASNERKTFVREISHLSGMLTTLIDFVNADDPNDLWLHAVSELVTRNGPLDQLSFALQELKIRLMPVSGIRKLGQTLVWKQIKDDVKNLLSRIERLNALIEMALELDHIKLSLEIKSALGDIAINIGTLGANTAAIKNDTTTIRGDTSFRQKKELLNHICSKDYLQQHSDAIKKHHHGTGDWFLANQMYQNWAKSSHGTLVCPGVPGAGKTIMAALVIEQHLRAASSVQHPVVFIYYDYKSSEQQNLRHTLETALRQVVDFLSGVPEPVDKLYAHTPTTEEIKFTLQELLTKCKGLTIVTDALDECHDRHRTDVLSWIRDLQNSLPVRYLATTRDFYVNSSHPIFETQPLLEVKASRHDLELYTRSRSKTLRVKNQPDLIEDLVKGVVAAAEGMFLLARLLMDSFQSRLKVKMIKQDLQALPKGIDAYDKAYGDALLRIFGQDKDYQDSARKILSLILCTKRPLKTIELQHALMVDPEDTELDQDNCLEAEDILMVCAGLITIDETSEVVRFVHYTTQEYLLRKQDDWLPEAESEIARTCLNYLALQDFDRAVDESIIGAEHATTKIEAFALANYAVNHGPFHWSTVLAQETALRARLLTLLESSGTRSAIWVVAWFWRYSRHTDFDILHWFSQLGLRNLAELCLVNGFSPQPVDEDGWTPLFHAAAAGHESVVDLLLSYHVDIELKDDFGRTPLSHAASGGHESIVRLLIDCGASVDSVSRDGATPLSYAARENHESVVRLLLERDAKVDLATEKSRTALTYAAAGGHESIVQLLLGYNAAFDSRTHAGHTPLHVASRGFERVVQALLAHGCDPNSVCNQGRTPLSLAAEGGYFSIIDLLLNKGAKLSLVDRDGRGPLYFAIRAGSVDAVRLLCSVEGADVNAPDKFGQTPLSYALQRLEDSMRTVSGGSASFWTRTDLQKECYDHIVQILSSMGSVNLVSLRHDIRKVSIQTTE